LWAGCANNPEKPAQQAFPCAAHYLSTSRNSPALRANELPWNHSFDQTVSGEEVILFFVLLFPDLGEIFSPFPELFVFELKL
jgi:hypothetical protein